MSKWGIRLAEESKAALKAGEKLRLGALRLLSSAVKYREVELRRELTDEEFHEVVRTQVKRRREAAEAFEKGERPERAAAEREEGELLSAYLPPIMAVEEIDAIIEDAVAATGAAGPAEMGKVIGFVMKKAGPAADGSVVSARVRARLGGT